MAARNNRHRPTRFQRRHGRWPGWFGRPGGGFTPIWGQYGPSPSYAVPGHSQNYYEPVPGSIAYMPTNLAPGQIDPTASPTATSVGTRLVPVSQNALEQAALDAENTPHPGAQTFAPSAQGFRGASDEEEYEDEDKSDSMTLEQMGMLAGGLLLVGLLLGR